MRRHLALLLTAAIFCIDAFAQKKNFEYEPWVMNVTQESFTVLFKTTCDALCWVEIAPDDGTDWYRAERTRFYQDISGRHYFGRMHSIEVDGLKAGTRYRYRIAGRRLADGSNPYNIKWDGHFTWKPSWGGYGHSYAPYSTVKTLDTEAEECRFSMFNDIHGNDARYKALAAGMPEGNDFILLNGDIVSFCANVDSVIVHTFCPIASHVAQTPVFFARGNHEGRGNEWHGIPACFPSATGEFYYVFRQGPLALIVLDAGEDKPDSDVEYSGTAAYDRYRARELEWLKSAVKDPQFAQAPQKICIMHIPTLDIPKAWYTQAWITEHFAPVLREAGVSLMLSGHHHRYIWSPKESNTLGYSVLANSNAERLDVVATADSVVFRCYDEKGVLTHEGVQK